jgi:ferredoxin
MYLYSNLCICITFLCSFVLLASSFNPLKINRASSVAPNSNIFRSHVLSAKKNWAPPTENEGDAVTDTNSENGFTYTVEMSKQAGISWGSDLSFKWVKVLDIEPNGAAAEAKMIQKGDYVIGFGNSSMIAQDFDFVLTSLYKQPAILNYTFFRGRKEQLLGEPVLEPSDLTCVVTVVQAGKPEVKLECPGGTNLRRLLVGNGINVYRSITRWTNCNGNQRCGTCIVDISEGEDNCTRRALDEEMVLSENPPNYRLSCVTSVFGDVTVEIMGPVGAAQWTR